MYRPVTPCRTARRSALRHLVETADGSAERAVTALLGGAPGARQCRFLRRASFARIASWTNTASPFARFSKYALKRGSAVYVSARLRCIPWLHG